MITQSKVQVYTDQQMTNQVGGTITTNSDAEVVNLNISTLGVHLNGGTQYWVRAQATGTGGTSQWSEPTPFVTLIEPLMISSSVNRTQVQLRAVLNYLNAYIQPLEYGYFISKYPTGLNYTAYRASSEEELYNMDITGLEENTTYYWVAYVIDSQYREYDVPWADAAYFTTGYNLPSIYINEIICGSNYISGVIDCSSTNPLTNVKVSIVEDGQVVRGYEKNLSPVTGMQNFTFTNGETDGHGTCVITPQTSYHITVTAENSGGTVTADTHATTSEALISGIFITDINGISTGSANVILSLT